MRSKKKKNTQSKTVKVVKNEFFVREQLFFIT